MTDRDDLAADLIAADETYGQRVYPPWDKIADHLLAAGWSRPRVVTTSAELDALPPGAIALVPTPDGSLVAQAAGHGLWHIAALDSGPVLSSRLLRGLAIGLPGPSILWSPPAETDGPTPEIRAAADHAATVMDKLLADSNSRRGPSPASEQEQLPAETDGPTGGQWCPECHRKGCEVHGWWPAESVGPAGGQ